MIARLLLATVLLAPAFAIAQISGGDDWVAESDANTRLVLDVQGEFGPEGASAQGLAEFDEGVSDLDENVYERSLAANRELLATLEQRLATTEHPKVRQDVEILIQSIEDGIETAELQRRYMLPYYNLPQSLFFSFRSLLDPRTAPERKPAALVRLQRYTGQAEGYQPITELAIARTEERFDQPGLVGPYVAEVERDLGNVDRFLAGLEQLFATSELEGWNADLALLQEQLREYADWVRAEILPRAREGNQLPEAIYADNLKNFGVRATPDELIESAQFGFQEIRQQMKAIARQVADKRGWENGELMAVMARLKEEQIPADEVLDVYRQRLATIEDIIRREDIVSLPEREASIRMATEAEAAAVPAPFMSPPQLIGNTGQYGEFVLVASNPNAEGSVMDDWTHESITWALAVHEARPGHEMQFSRLVEDGTSQARAIFAFNSANVEGWGLYSEAIMLEYLPLEGQLFTLFARLQRAGRMFMDPMVNTGRMTPDEAVRFMTEHIGLSEAMARSEADRYAFLAPGQATSYYYGYRNLMRLRTEVELILGERFDQRAFHDFILAQGLLPPDVLREAVMEEFVGETATDVAKT